MSEHEGIRWVEEYVRRTGAFAAILDFAPDGRWTVKIYSTPNENGPWKESPRETRLVDALCALRKEVEK